MSELFHETIKHVIDREAHRTNMPRCAYGQVWVNIIL